MRLTNVIIIDDERLAREEIKRMLARHPDMKVVAEAGSAADGALLIRQSRPELVFLDVQMPGLSGFDMLAMLDYTPVVIFITAYDEYAVKAFEVNALDYLVKPVRDERFEKMIEKVRLQINNTLPIEERRLFVKDGGNYHFIRMAELVLVDAAGNYAKLYFNNKTALVKRSLDRLETELEQRLFFRINRSQIVNLTCIQNIQRSPDGKLALTLKTGLVASVSERRSAMFTAIHKI